MADELNSIILVIVYIILITVGFYSVYLYRKAYYQMKRTKLIKSVYLLLSALLVENIYFGLAAITNHLHLGIYNYIMHPLGWLVPKVFILIALIYFIYTSLCKTEYIPKKTVNKDKI